MKNSYKSTLLVCSVLWGGALSAQDVPLALPYSDYSGDSFVANWEAGGSDSGIRLSVFKAGESELVSEDFSGIHSSEDGKINLDNPNYPEGWVISVSEAGKADVGFDGTRNRILLDATGDYVGTANIVGCNVRDFVIAANLANAEGVTKENSSIFKVDYYDYDGIRVAGGQIESLYFAMNHVLNMREALGYNPADVASVRISVEKDEEHNVGDILLQSLSYTYDKPSYVVRQEAVEGGSYKVENLDAETVYWYYAQGEKDGELSPESNIVKVDGFLIPQVGEASDITSSSYVATWTRLPKASGYRVQNYQYVRVEEDGDVAIVAENFDKATEGTQDAPAKVTNPDEITDYPGWSGGNLIMAGGMMGASAGRFPVSLSYIYSPKMNLGGQGGKYKVRVKARGKTGDYLSVYRVNYLIDTDGDGNPDNLNIHKTVPFDENGLLEDTWEMTDGSDGMQLSFEENKMQQFFIDEVSVTQEVAAGTVMTYMKELAVIDDGATTSCKFGNLEAGCEYGYEVRGLRLDSYGNEELSEVSEISLVQLPAHADGEVACSGVSVFVRGNTATVVLSEDMPISLYTIDGKQVANVSGVSGQNDVTIPSSGIYVLKAGGTVCKLLAR